MEKSSNTPPTLESVWAAFRETDRLLKESTARFERDIKESREEFKKNLKESREEFNKNLMASREEFDKEMKESRKEFEESRKEFDRRMGAWSYNIGSFAEEYFSNSFEHGKRNFFGEEFDKMIKNAIVKAKGYSDEYDIIFINGHSIGIIETKFKAHENDIPKVLKKARTFKVNFPEYQNHKVYLGLASMAFYPELELECEAQGIAIVKQVGDTVVINDKHLKTF